MTKLGLVLISVLSFSCLSFAAEESVYVRLYRERVNMAKAAVKRQQAETAFQANHYNRARSLLSKAAISHEEYERIQADYNKSVAEEELFSAKVREEEATLEVVQDLVKSGQQVPVCR